ncbi:hypothetical protein SNK03_009680 [Fusarium graminearum]
MVLSTMLSPTSLATLLSLPSECEFKSCNKSQSGTESIRTSRTPTSLPFPRILSMYNRGRPTLWARGIELNRPTIMLDDRMHLCEQILTAPFSASRLAMYGAPAAVGVMLFANGIPRVQRDILQKIPVLGGFFRKEVHPADNPF